MQILRGAGDLAGARGWMWRVERHERTGRRATVVSLARAGDRAMHAWTALGPAEPMARVAATREVGPTSVADAVACVQRARLLERPAFAVRAAMRLAGEIHAWQLAAAVAFARGHARVLLADPVGMGKTVSAALAIAECLDEGPDRRCLVVAPGHLLSQWRDELRSRVAVAADIVDAASIARLERGLPAGMPAWARPGCLIVSIDFVKQPHVARALEALTWDLLAVDEAHVACGQSARHAACDMLARRARRVLLITATPSDGGGDRLAALTRLGDAREPVVLLRHDGLPSRVARERVLRVRAAADVAALHRALASYGAWIAEAPAGDEPAIALLAALLTKRALSSAHAAHISLQRRAALLDQHEPIVYQPDLFEVEDDSALLGARTGKPREEERRRLAMLIDTAGRAARNERRVAALLRLVRRAREPVIVFTCFRDTARLLARRMAPHVEAHLVHGELPPAAAAAAIASFTRGCTRVLIATDVASQGLNLHARCRWVIHFDLPWRPSTVRQRNGRVDRLGQARRPHATWLVDRTPLAEVMTSRASQLDERMRDEEFVTRRRWRVLAEAEAARASAHPGRCECTPVPAHDITWPITVAEVTLSAPNGITLDRRAHAVAADADAAMRWADAAAQRLGARIRRALRARAASRIARERSVHAAAREALSSARVQRGLFDHRADRARAASSAALAGLARERRAHIARHLAERKVACARVEILAVFANAPAGQ